MPSPGNKPAAIPSRNVESSSPVRQIVRAWRPHDSSRAERCEWLPIWEPGPQKQNARPEAGRLPPVNAHCDRGTSSDNPNYLTRTCVNRALVSDRAPPHPTIQIDIPRP